MKVSASLPILRTLGVVTLPNNSAQRTAKLPSKNQNVPYQHNDLKKPRSRLNNKFLL